MITVNHFEEQYIALRKKENRFYSDGQVARLPEIESSHPHYNEWQIRKRSSTRLIHYLKNKRRKLRILEVGCGNGWLCHQLSQALQATVVGIDINNTELQQAKRVFGKPGNLDFLLSGIEQLNNQKFDIIIFAASIQYFPDADYVLRIAQFLLDHEGEIHILDSNLYNQNEVASAKQRSLSYYQSIGFPGMSDFYFHHSLETFKSYNHKILYNPNSILNRLNKNKNPFYWILIGHA